MKIYKTSEKERNRVRLKSIRYRLEQPERVREWGRKNSKGPKGKFNSYKKNARNRDIKFDISFEEFMELWKRECGYCGSEIETIGIDRIDNTKGYIKRNIVSCCRKCNFMKKNMNLYEFVNQCYKIVKKHKGVKMRTCNQEVTNS